ncbi:MAG TPA: hypothetical protein EYH11_00500 [Sulfurimonas autotrophica]|nr:hypothetical protein [Sulfurimonas autotrophica]
MMGVIFQFNSDDGKGLIMLSDGETKEFSRSQWVDKTRDPAIGLKIFYDSKTNKVSSQREDQETDTIKSEEENTQDVLSLNSVDEYITHFKEDGFNLVKDFEDDEERRIIFRKYTVEEPLEVIITRKNDQISLVYMVNGKKVK